MLTLITAADLSRFQEEHPNTPCDLEELEQNMVYTSPQQTVNIPSVFLSHIFPIMYGVPLSDASFHDGNQYNWDYNNLKFIHHS